MQEPINVSFEVPMLSSIVLLIEVKSPASLENQNREEMHKVVKY